MKAELKDDNLVITLPLNKVGSPSKSTGATLIHASTGGGAKTGIMLPTGELTISVNAYTPNPNKPAKGK